VVLEKSLFDSDAEDFFKIIFATICFFILSLNSHFLSSEWTIFVIVYVLDAGHVYSTFAEVLADPDESKKSYVFKTLALSFFINYIILTFQQKYFFYFIFYFTIFHNLRQGLGLMLLYKMKDQFQRVFYKTSYYFLTIMPFIIFHFRNRNAQSLLEQSVLKPIDMGGFLLMDTVKLIYALGLGAYLLVCVVILTGFVFQKQFKALKMALFFSIVYGYAFVFSQNEFQSYMLLVVSHAVPYYFLMQRRIRMTHSISFFRKNPSLVLALIFIIGGLFEYNHDAIYKLTGNFEKILMALLTTPLIAHFIFDSLIWKKTNKRFQIFQQRFIQQ
jgi:hypothetical protein